LDEKFKDDYVKVYPVKSITPYLHCFVSHLNEFRKLHGNFDFFNLAATIVFYDWEKYNKFSLILDEKCLI
jgi:hypothetical protein